MKRHGLTLDSKMRQYLKLIGDGGGRVELDEDAGTVEAFDPDGKLCLKAIQKGSKTAPWIATYYDTELFQWSHQ